MPDSSIPAILRERASLQPNDTAFTFVDYEQDWDGVTTSLTWAQLYRRTTNFAREMSTVAKTGDRAVIIAPQSLDYLVAFLGSLEAGLIAVPLSTPMVGAHDERVSAVLRDAAPTVVLTTSSIADLVAPYVEPQTAGPRRALLEVDRLDLDGRHRAIRREEPRPDHRLSAVHLGIDQDTCRRHGDLPESVGQLRTGHARLLPRVREGRTARDDGRVLAALLPRHGAVPRRVRPHPRRMADGGHHAAVVPRPAGPVDSVDGQQPPCALTAGPNFAFELAAAPHHGRGHGRARPERRGRFGQRRRTRS